MKTHKNGFTLAEILIAIGLVGIISAIVFSTLIHNKPNKNKAMYKKAYYVIERNVAEMIMDDDTFPTEIDDGSKGLAYYDPSADVDGDYDGDSLVRNLKNTGIKFCKTFKGQLNLIRSSNCDEVASSMTMGSGTSSVTLPNDPTFVTSDDIAWYITPNIICDPTDTVTNPPESPCTMPDAEIPDCPNSMTDKLPYICVFFDVNGNERPNEFTGLKGQPEVRDADRGFVYVYWNGKIEIPVGQASKYIKSVTVF